MIFAFVKNVLSLVSYEKYDTRRPLLRSEYNPITLNSALAGRSSSGSAARALTGTSERSIAKVNSNETIRFLSFLDFIPSPLLSIFFIFLGFSLISPPIIFIA